jgi:hypothetical protein
MYISKSYPLQWTVKDVTEGILRDYLDEKIKESSMW